MRLSPSWSGNYSDGVESKPPATNRRLTGTRINGTSLRVKVRSLFCYWAAHELKISLSDLARKLGMTAAGVGYAVRRGEAISIGGNYQLID